MRSSTERSEPPWFLYLIECTDGALYTGIALDPAARFEQHRTGKGAKYTRANPPVRLIGAMAYPDRSTASRAENAFKKLKATEKRARVWAFEEVSRGDFPLPSWERGAWGARTGRRAARQRFLWRSAERAHLSVRHPSSNCG